MMSVGKKHAGRNELFLKDAIMNRYCLFGMLMIVHSVVLAGGNLHTRVSIYHDSENELSSLLEFTYIPQYGTSEDLQGRIHDLNPTSFKVAVYIFVEGSGWWTKPTFAQPLTTIRSDSTWTCDITTGGNDVYATQIHAFLLANGITPPQAEGLSDLPSSLFTISTVNVSTIRAARSITFSGDEWWVKASVLPVGPGPNFFPDSSENVWVDTLDQLHMRITKRNGNWYCPEVINKISRGYGKYCFEIKGGVSNLDKNVVLGLFTWDNSSQENHREIDIEIARWGNASDPTNAQYVVQPYTHSGNLIRWTIPSNTDSSAHCFDWKPDSIDFSSRSDSIISASHYTGSDIPHHGNENTRINLWLFNGVPPSDTNGVVVVIKKYEFIGATVDVRDDDHSAFIPSILNLDQNYPNPFNPVTIINYSVPPPAGRDLAAGGQLPPPAGRAGIGNYVTLRIYNVLGEEVAMLVNETEEAGYKSVRFNAQVLPSGTYFYKLTVGSFTKTKKLVLLR